MSGMVEGKVALVTGAGSGIGRAASQKFAAEGAKVVVSDVNVEGGEQTVALIQQAGGDAIFVKCDVSKAAEAEALIKAAVDQYGRLDCAYNNAGVAGDATNTINCTEENFDLNYNVNLKGVWLCMKYEIMQFLAQGAGSDGKGGSIVSTASIAGLLGFKNAPAYVAAKHGVVGLTKTAALEFATKNIRVNAVCPGPIETPLIAPLFSNEKAKAAIMGSTPMNRVGQPEEMANVAVWLCSDRASFVTGHSLAADAGFVVQ